MTLEQQRIAIAEACGWKPCNDGYKTWMAPESRLRTKSEGGGIEGYWCHESELLDYLHNLNAMHEAEKMITDDQWPKYRDLLSDLAFKASLPGAKWFRPHCCTAAQRAEAFLKTLGLWKD